MPAPYPHQRMVDTESDTESDGGYHGMHAAFKSPEAEAARKSAEAAAKNPTPHRGLRHYKTKSGNGRVQARHFYTDSAGKKIEKKGRAHGWGTRSRQVQWHKTKEEAQDAAALDHDNLKNEHEGAEERT